MRKICTILLALVASVGTLFAWDYERVLIGDLYYNLDATNQTAEVTSENSVWPYWSTEISVANIPSTVTYNEVEYSVTSIGNRAFDNNVYLITATIPNSVTSIGNGAFSSCFALTSVTIGNSVTSIGEGAFQGCLSLTSIEIPNSVTSIGWGAFQGCSGLTSVTIPNSVTIIEDIAFGEVLNIIYYGDASGSPWGARSINGYVDGYLIYSDDTRTNLLGCSSAATGKIIIPSSVTSIGDNTFYYCRDITSIEIPSSVTYIGNYAFWACFGLTSVNIPKSVTGIGEETFAYCGFTSFDIPNNITNIGNGAFRDCSSLTSVTIPNSVTSIGNSAFSSTGLTSVTIPNSVTSIGEEPFARCLHLIDINVAEDNPNYVSSNGVLFNKDMTTIIQYPAGKNETEYTIPNCVTSIGSMAFSECTNLTSVNIPNSVTSIGSRAFLSCKKIASITLPESVVSMGGGTFVWMDNLTTITCYATTPPIFSSIGDINKSVTLYVPAESVDAYKAADQWKEFMNILPIESPIETKEEDINIYYLDKEKDELHSELVTLHVPTAPVIAGFTFLRWNVVAGTLADGIYLQAVYESDTPTSAPSVYTNPANPAQKLLRNGNVYILTDDSRTYTLTGQEVK